MFHVQNRLMKYGSSERPSVLMRETVQPLVRCLDCENLPEDCWTQAVRAVICLTAEGVDPAAFSHCCSLLKG